MRRRDLLLAGMGLAGAGLATVVRGQQARYPGRVIKLVIPFAAGGSTDVLGRRFAHHMGEVLGQPMLADNRGGAAGVLGCSFVASSPPDGYTLLLGTTGTHAINPTSMVKPAYDAQKDFAPIGLIGTQPMGIAVNPKVPAQTLAELIALIRANPGKFGYASAGNGGIAHLSFEIFKQLGGNLQATHVPYSGGAPALRDVMGGHVPILSDTFSSIVPYHRQGQLRVLATTGPKRSPIAPDIPAAVEFNLPDMVTATSGIFLAPAGTPAAVIDTLQAAMAKVMQMPSFQADLEKLGLEPEPASTPARAAAFIASEIAKWAPVIKATGTTM